MGMQIDYMSDLTAFPYCWRWLNPSTGLPDYSAFLQCLLTAKTSIEPHNTANIIGNTCLQDKFFENSVEERHEFWDQLDSVWEPIRKQFAWYDTTLLFQYADASTHLHLESTIHIVTIRENDWLEISRGHSVCNVTLCIHEKFSLATVLKKLHETTVLFK